MSRLTWEQERVHDQMTRNVDVLRLPQVGPRPLERLAPREAL